jgi:hypothetical protein
VPFSTEAESGLSGIIPTALKTDRCLRVAKALLVGR